MTKPLGMTYTPKETHFRVYAPNQEAVELLLYANDTIQEKEVWNMKPCGDYFECTITGDLEGQFYCYRVGEDEVCDPASVASSCNSMRSAIVDLAKTNPPYFAESKYVSIDPQEAIIAEVHVADFSFHPSAGNAFAGKYLAFTQRGTRYEGLATGLDHLKELGVTHIHLLPVADFSSIREESDYFGRPDQYNWGYDPELYNVPEGSYATNAKDPYCRIFELKELVQALHEEGFGVIMDVVYNHTYRCQDSPFQILAPYVFHRNKDGVFSNGSGCGNEIASEHPVVRQFIVDSLLYWQREYKIDGFRFDLMGLMDLETTQEVVKALRAINPHTILYGEPWGGGPSLLPAEQQTLWGTQKDCGFALFNEQFRDTMRGDNDGFIRGYVQGDTRFVHKMRGMLLGSIDYSELHPGQIVHPVESINYFNAHDNLIFEDKLQRSVGDIPMLTQMTKFAFSLLLTAEGIPFFHLGNEFRRSKSMVANSYNAPFSINAIDWRKKGEHEDLHRYVCRMIAFRKAHPIFQLADGAEVKRKVHPVDVDNPHWIVLLYEEEKQWLLCVHSNAWSSTAEKVMLPINAVKARCLCNADGEEESEYMPISNAQFSIQMPALCTQIYALEK